ncbi:hypothetical protein BJY24_000196 [Nocardia transvalensis]|uniref:Secreted protein n=1 Tax=Nocardia transvalensis TaxID=37333 RepID=A0A7W9UFL3_9NOCA|nr:hypothetical protein [Nocardia transvalensis]MBB5911329.1 hypothetical protein [Nocardia transvalensis]
MNRHRPVAIRVVLVVGATVGLLAAGSGPAGAAPAVTFGGGATVTAHVTGAKPGHDCQIAARDIDGPWQPVGLDGTVDLDSGPVRAGPHLVRVLCENRLRGDVATHSLGRETVVTTR